ncbi:MAG: hypothetical protein WA771_06530 [Chthoniobacterales bacterium]
MTGVFRGWAFSDPAAAAQTLTLQLLGGLGPAYDAVAYHWADKDPSSAIQWTQSIPADVMGGRVARRVIESWARRDAATASEAVSELPLGRLRDEATRGLATAIRELDPQAAMKWIDSIGDASLRDKARADLDH